MKKTLIAAMSLLIFAVSCKKDLDLNHNNDSAIKQLINGGGSGVDTLVGSVSSNTTLTRTTYLKGVVYVDPGFTLTVNAGVTIKGSPGSGTPDTLNLANNKGTLVVQKGGKLIANGTPTSPIIWTSTASPGARTFGDWGGIIILGQAPIKTTSGATTNFFEALPLSDPRNYYGGANANDNSGSMQYNRIEFCGGITAKPNQEVNGLTLCGVGKGTTLHHIEVSNSGDDAFEFFGGTVNAHHLISFANKDDDFDFDEAYQGDLQFIIGYRTQLCDNSGSHMIETDNNASASVFGGTNRTTPFIANATLVGPHSTAPAIVGGFFDGCVYVRREGRIILANSIMISDSLPVALGLTGTTRDAIDNITPATPDHSYIRYNIWQTYSPHSVVWDNDENPSNGALVDGSANADPDLNLINELGNATQGNTAVVNPADVKLDGVLKPISGSPALSGGISLTSIDPFFVSTTQRGAVRTSDVWTSIGTWISTATQ